MLDISLRYIKHLNTFIKSSVLCKTSKIYAIVLFFTILVIRDAVGIRRYIGAQGEVINDLVKDLGNDQYLNQSYPKMKERVGHTKKQILVGSLIGLIVALATYYFIA